MICIWMEAAKGIFCFRFFSWIIFPQAPEYNNRVIWNFFKTLRRYSQVKVHQRYPRHRWQILPQVPLVLLIPVANSGNNIRLLTTKRELKGKIYLYVNSTTQRCSKKIIKTFLIVRFFRLPAVSWHWWCTLSCEYLCVFEKIRNGPNGILRDLGETDS